VALEAAGVQHAFSTRIGGVSAPPFDSLNFGNPAGFDQRDPLEAITENHRRLLKNAFSPAQYEVLRVHQVHGNRVIVATPEGPWDNSTQADGIISTSSAQLASVRTADCAPILLCTEDGLAVAAVHAGWRGVVAEIVPIAVAQLRQFHPGKALHAAIGPCIGPHAFEVGPEVLDAFAALFGDAPPIITRQPNGKGHVDLRLAIFRQLQTKGIEEDKIDSSDRCTFRDKGEFFSHRREAGLTGRMISLIGPRAV
jgi:YfiH family protein